uniref:Uncharacterized protein n=1 Tax=Spongospora subterranea TaxID=70186 RepID=A0A0H5RSG8_9EUKA|eukprot:CRZ11684.1 hypothetical protein [Spongospora subterranea]
MKQCKRQRTNALKKSARSQAVADTTQPNMLWSSKLSKLVLTERYQNPLVEARFKKDSNAADISLAWDFYVDQFDSNSLSASRRSAWIIEPFEVSALQLMARRVFCAFTFVSERAVI